MAGIDERITWIIVSLHKSAKSLEAHVQVPTTKVQLPTTKRSSYAEEPTGGQSQDHYKEKNFRALASVLMNHVNAWLFSIQIKRAQEAKNMERKGGGEESVIKLYQRRCMNKAHEKMFHHCN